MIAARSSLDAVMPARQPAGETIPATLPPHGAARRSWDVVVVGAGPAGASLAARLARAGLATLLLDRSGMPRAKVCGCCLSHTAVEELSALGLALGSATPGASARPNPLVPPAAVPVRRMWVAGQGARVSVAGIAPTVVSREALDRHLVRAAIAAGCHWLPHAEATRVDGVGSGPAMVSLTVSLRAPLAAGSATQPPAAGSAEPGTGTRVGIECRMLVLATGIGGGVRIAADAGLGPTGIDAAAPSGAAAAGMRSGSSAGSGRFVAQGSLVGVGTTLPAHASGLEPGELAMAVVRGGYCGLVRLEDGRLDLAAALDPALLAGGGPAVAVNRMLEAAAVPPAWIDRRWLARARFRGTPPLTRRAPLMAGLAGRIVRVGDAAGFVEPFTGEGIGWALAGGRVLADAIIAAAATPPFDPRVVADAYRAGYADQVAARHTRCGRVARWLRSPRLVAGALHAARLAPWATRYAIPLLFGHNRGFIHPREGSLST